MHQALDPRLQFHKCAIRHQVDDFAFDLRTHRIFLVDVVPRIGQLLLQAQAHPLLLAVNIQHHDINILADLKNFRRMPDSTPAHVGDVQQSVDAIEVDKRAEIGNVFDGPFADVARGHFTQEFLTAFGPLLLDQFAAGEHDVLSLLVDFNDFKLICVVQILGQVFGSRYIDLRGRQKGLHADVDQQSPFDHAFDFAGDGSSFVADAQDALPVLLEFSLFLGEYHHPLLVFQFLD